MRKPRKVAFLVQREIAPLEAWVFTDQRKLCRWLRKQPDAEQMAITRFRPNRPKAEPVEMNTPSFLEVPVP
jgi:hypothetical protein